MTKKSYESGLISACHAFLPQPHDLPGTQLTFVRRLARENRWSTAYAQRVFDEYWKFVYLAVESGHRVTPSDQVDQTWHLHLAYTESYWTEMCGKLLGRPLHTARPKATVVMV